MGVLPVPPGVSAVLDGELRTAVQAAQAHGAFLLAPDRPPLPHLDGLHGAVRRTSAAADAALLQAEVGRLPDRSVVEGLREPLREKRGGTGDIRRLVWRSRIPRMAASMSASVVLVKAATFSGVERSKMGVQVSGIRTA